ncbi:endonuclease/exonuclease/phosphatase family protein [Mycobacterium sp. MYCO198283]|uniref:endonuclease/exonuclease/phosphatase family protein n=1 Tax=Mycobacterium sp. MYCO198283 TaxID=2883505 RepID=UPI001E5CB1C6|nr:endonuclease/exonuclease/phosphatase family protein [Mycobacterium sp. MYCO198283]MCG5431924.1 endonuclease/exonuclease/phosphatase family protein [Mycobacterium sp. MYCO198283]
MRFVGYAAMALAVAGLVVRFLPTSTLPVFLLSAVSPYLMACALVAALGFAIGRRWRPFAAALALAIAGVATLQPFAAHRVPGTGQAVRILSANLGKGSVEVSSFADWATQHADIVAVQELTPYATQEFERSALAEVFPYKRIDPQQESRGVGIYSRYPLRQIDESPLLIAATVAVPGTSAGMTVGALRIPNPLSSSIGDWRAGLRRVADQFRDPPTGCLTLAGDFNSTVHMRDFRELLAAGFADAAQQAGDRFVATFPSVNVMPPLIGIDHVLTRGCVATSVSTVSVMRSDHRGLAVAVEVPR